MSSLFTTLPVGLVDGGNELAQNGIGAQQAVGQQQLGGIVQRFEQKGHGLVQGMALGQQHLTVQLFIAIASEL